MAARSFIGLCRKKTDRRKMIGPAECGLFCGCAKISYLKVLTLCFTYGYCSPIAATHSHCEGPPPTALWFHPLPDHRRPRFKGSDEPA